MECFNQDLEIAETSRIARCALFVRCICPRADPLSNARWTMCILPKEPGFKHNHPRQMNRRLDVTDMFSGRLKVIQEGDDSSCHTQRTRLRVL